MKSPARIPLEAIENELEEEFGRGAEEGEGRGGLSVTDLWDLRSMVFKSSASSVSSIRYMGTISH